MQFVHISAAVTVQHTIPYDIRFAGFFSGLNDVEALVFLSGMNKHELLEVCTGHSRFDCFISFTPPSLPILCEGRQRRQHEGLHCC